MFGSRKSENEKPSRSILEAIGFLGKDVPQLLYSAVSGTYQACTGYKEEAPSSVWGRTTHIIEDQGQPEILSQVEGHDYTLRRPVVDLSRWQVSRNGHEVNPKISGKICECYRIMLRKCVEWLQWQWSPFSIVFTIKYTPELWWLCDDVFDPQMHHGSYDGVFYVLENFVKILGNPRKHIQNHAAPWVGVGWSLQVLSPGPRNTGMLGAAKCWVSGLGLNAWYTPRIFGGTGVLVPFFQTNPLMNGLMSFALFIATVRLNFEYLDVSKPTVLFLGGHEKAIDRLSPGQPGGLKLTAPSCWLSVLISDFCQTLGTRGHSRLLQNPIDPCHVSAFTLRFYCYFAGKYHQVSTMLWQTHFKPQLKDVDINHGTCFMSGGQIGAQKKVAPHISTFWLPCPLSQVSFKMLPQNMDGSILERNLSPWFGSEVWP